MKPENSAKSPVLRMTIWRSVYLQNGLNPYKIKALEKPGKLNQEMRGFRKNYKLDIPTISLEQVANWIS